MKHLRDMRSTFPHLHDRSAVMGLAAGNVPPHEQRRRAQEALEAKKARRQAVPVRVAFLVRPGLPPCHTSVTFAGPGARVVDVVGDLWDTFTEERNRRGSELGPLPSYSAADYCLRPYNAYTGAMGPECPPRALLGRLLQAQPAPQPSTPTDGPVTPTRFGGGAFAAPSALRKQHGAAPVASADTDGAAREGGGQVGIGDTSTIEANHFAFVLRQVFLDSERVVSAERKTRAAIEQVFEDSLDALSCFEREKRSLSQGLQLQREEFAEARLALEQKESAARAVLDHDWDALVEAVSVAFRERYAALERTMLQLVEKMAKLREQHRATMAAAATRSSGAAA